MFLQPGILLTVKKKKNPPLSSLPRVYFVNLIQQFKIFKCVQ